MLAYFAGLNPVLQALLAGLFTWGLTALGAGGIFFTREINRRTLDGMRGFAGGIMISASFWSLSSFPGRPVYGPAYRRHIPERT